MSFASLKKNRATSTAKLTEMVKSGGKQVFEEDKRYWQPEVDDKRGIGSAVIRFLPAIEGEDFPFVTLYEHAFQRNGGWYIEKSRSTLGKGEADPVLEYNDKLWNSGNPADRKLVSGDDVANIKGSKRKQYFIANIYVIKHDARPEDEGKVFLFKFGFKIKEKIDQLLTPEFDDISPVNVYDFWEGANFNMRISRQGKHRNYDKSSFGEPTQLLADEDAMAAIYESQYSLKAEIRPELFKSYDQLAARLAKVLGTAGQQAEGRGQSAGREAPAREDRHTSRRDTQVSDDDSDDTFFNRLKDTDMDDEIPF
jgi:hypothetical protein